MTENPKSARDTNIIIKWQKNPNSVQDTNVVINWKRILKVRKKQT